MTMTPDEIATRGFTPSADGYHQGEVREFLARIAREQRALSASLPEGSREVADLVLAVNNHETRLLRLEQRLGRMLDHLAQTTERLERAQADAATQIHAARSAASDHQAFLSRLDAATARVEASAVQAANAASEADRPASRARQLPASWSASPTDSGPAPISAPAPQPPPAQTQTTRAPERTTASPIPAAQAGASAPPPPLPPADERTLRVDPPLGATPPNTEPVATGPATTGPMATDRVATAPAKQAEPARAAEPTPSAPAPATTAAATTAAAPPPPASAADLLMEIDREPLISDSANDLLDGVLGDVLDNIEGPNT